jgi:trafficking protein particle complex subunit 3
MSSNKPTAFHGNALWQKQPKANAELFALTYGAMVGELIRDLEKTDKIQEELDRMGHSMGIRCVEEFLAKAGGDVISNTSNNSFADTADLMKMAIKMFLGVSAIDYTPPDGNTTNTTTAGNATGGSGSGNSSNQYSIFLPENPLAIFVELPEDRLDLEYSQLLCGLVRGMLEMLQFDVSCQMVQSQLKGDDVNEIRVQLQQVLQEGAGEEYQEE